MSEQVRIDAGELSVEEIIATLENGQHVIVQTELLGSTHEVMLRHDGTVYYCDTPTTLHKHDSSEEMRQCILNHGYGTE